MILSLGLFFVFCLLKRFNVVANGLDKDCYFFVCSFWFRSRAVVRKVFLGGDSFEVEREVDLLEFGIRLW